MGVTVVGVSHRTAPLPVREHFAHATEEVPPALRAVRGGGAAEALLLSTCNRTECYVADGATDAATAIVELLSRRLGADASPYVYVRGDPGAGAHL